MCPMCLCLLRTLIYCPSSICMTVLENEGVLEGELAGSECQFCEQGCKQGRVGGLRSSQGNESALYSTVSNAVSMSL